MRGEVDCPSWRWGGFAAPSWFALLGLVAAVVAGYVWAQRRTRRYLLRFASLELLERVAPRRPGWPRHIPAVLLVVALLLLTLGLAGPTANAQIPHNRAVVMLVIDVSLSMNSTDVTPTRRLAAAQDAAISFVRQLTAMLLAGLGAGDAQAALAFIRRFQPVVFGVAFTIVGDSGLAEDIAQQAFERAWRHAGLYDPRRELVRTWLTRIVHNLAVDAVRVRLPAPVDPHKLLPLIAAITDRLTTKRETPDRTRLRLPRQPLLDLPKPRHRHTHGQRNPPLRDRARGRLNHADRHLPAHPRHGAWAGPAPVDRDTLTTAALINGNGHTLATARFRSPSKKSDRPTPRSHGEHPRQHRSAWSRSVRCSSPDQPDDQVNDDDDVERQAARLEPGGVPEQLLHLGDEQ